MSEVTSISTEKQAEMLQSSDISKTSLRNGEKKHSGILLLAAMPLTVWMQKKRRP